MASSTQAENRAACLEVIVDFQSVSPLGRFGKVAKGKANETRSPMGAILIIASYQVTYGGY